FLCFHPNMLGVAVLLLHLWGTLSFPTPACPVPCLCQRGPLLNCSTLGLTEIPTRIPPTAVLDLSYNLLVTIPVPAYQSLRNLNALVNVSFNRWKCDCNLQTLRRWISFDTEMGDASWQVVCVSPPHHAGKDLLHLKDSELTCPTHESSTSAFILGVLLRPLLDKLWRRIRSKRQSTPPPTTTSSTGPQPYVNEGYCDVED
uniref:LRRCT domain-containing protein n=1 Tax=Sinocyclocheilus grahami TaxID=75366 RepID=A0A672MQV5_SINGR